ncbi:MAG: polysaccharide biosynthesis protein, partial [Lacrimispora sp.]
IRAGNVLGSNGSVVPHFIDQIKAFNKVTITDADMTRYFLTLPEAIRLLFKAAESSLGGETFVMKMPSCKILDMAKVLIKAYGDDHTEIEFSGARPGEKLDEVLVSRYESDHSYYFDDNYFLILPTLKINGLHDYYDKSKKLQKVSFKEYSSRDTLLNEEQIRDMLIKGGFLV